MVNDDLMKRYACSLYWALYDAYDCRRWPVQSVAQHSLATALAAASFLQPLLRLATLQRIVVTTLAISFYLSEELTAQVVLGTVVDSATTQVLAGAVVSVDSGRQPQRDVLTTEAGRFLVDDVGVGAVIIRVSMIGYDEWTLPVVIEEPTDTVRIHAMLVARPIDLPSIGASSRRRCSGADAGSVGPLLTLWHDVGVSLRGEQVARTESQLTFRVESFVRDVAEDSMVVLRDVRRVSVGRAHQAFGSLPIPVLDSIGFFRSNDRGGELFGPSVEVLLDPWFLNTHCLELLPAVESESHHSIAFEPNRERDRPDIRGRIMVEQESRILTDIEFEFVRVPGTIRGVPPPTGALRFERLASGQVVTTSFVLRTPLLQMHSRSSGFVVGTRLTGGVVIAASVDGTALFSAPRSSLRGRVVDTSGSGVEGAIVVLLGTDYEVTSDATGQYSFDDLPPGKYRAWAERVEGNDVVRSSIAMIDISVPIASTYDFVLGEAYLSQSTPTQSPYVSGQGS